MTLTLRTRILLLAAAVLIVAVVTTTFVLNRFTRAALLTQLDSNSGMFVREFGRAISPIVATNAAAQVAAQLNPMLDVMIHDNVQAVWVVDNQGAVLAHSQAPGLEEVTKLDSTDQADLKNALVSKRGGGHEQGTYFRVIAPMLDTQGQPIGATIMYFSIAGIEEALRQEVWLAVSTAVAVLIVGLLAFLLPARRVLQPLTEITGAAESLEAGTFDPRALAAAARRTDEIGHLARVIQRAGQEVQAREARLHQQVAELRIEVDTAKQARQVAEITETDYFQELQRKAQTLRHDHPE
jgi:methyl-accepting chemotaxis protein